MILEGRPGTYALISLPPRQVSFKLDRLGTMPLEPRYYVYLGSALAPGGLRARITHHQKQSQDAHWHID